MSEAARPSTRSLIEVGLAAVRREPALIAVRWAGDLAAVALAAAGTLVPVWALLGPGWAELLAELSGARDADTAALAAVDLYIVASVRGQALAALGALVVLWTLAFVVYCWVQGGFYGVLVAGDRGQAPAFSLGAFAAAARRRFWPFFWLVNLYAVVLGLIALVALLPLTLVPPAEPGEVPVAALAVLAAVTPPAAVAAAAAALWYALGCADLARAGTGANAAARRAVTAMRRHPGPVALTALVAAAAALAVAGFGAALGRVAGMIGGPAGVAGGAAVAAAQGLAMAAVATAHAAAMVRLMRAEMPAEEGT
jgi:hypothetical protein